jgi:hypothetical protein
VAEETVPEDVARLLERIESYEELEILLLLHEFSQQEWTPNATAERLGISVGDAQVALESLCALQLVAVTPIGSVRSFHYLSGRPVMDDTVQRLARAYDEQRLAIVKLMNANAIQRLRTGAIRMFADAFLIGSKKKDG